LGKVVSACWLQQTELTPVNKTKNAIFAELFFTWLKIETDPG
jgi:hypothetical protein